MLHVVSFSALSLQLRLALEGGKKKKKKGLLSETESQQELRQKMEILTFSAS